MSRSRKSTWVVGWMGAFTLVSAGAVLAADTMDAKAKFCDDFDHEVIMGGQLDKASHYLTNDFQEHNRMLEASGLDDFLVKMKAMRERFANRPAGGAAGGAAPPARTVLTNGDLVVFVTEQPVRPDPRNPGQTLPASSHFDVYQLRAGKIAAHWD
jgi:predicted SnoaL-like aldol condensation-catalyzing enzyme